MVELALQAVSKTFAGHVAAVQDLDLTIQDQELVVLVGPSGCGKTTTLRLIAGLDDPSHGAIRINGQPVDDVAPHNRNMAMVFQHGALYPHLSVYDNIAFGLRMRSRRSWSRTWWTRKHPLPDDSQLPQRQAIDRAVRQASRDLGLEHLLARKPQELSGGERQRVALGRAIVRQPAAFLLDEPLSYLDPLQRAEMRQIIKRLHRQLGATMVYVTHDQAEALTLGDRVVVMDHGQIQQVGTPEDVYQRPANQFVAQFIGQPAMNLVAGCLQLSEDQDSSDATSVRARFRGGGLTIDVALGGMAESSVVDGSVGDGSSSCEPNLSCPVVIGIRPEQIQLVPLSVPELSGPELSGPEVGGADLAVRQQTETDGLESEETQQAEENVAIGRVTQAEMLGATTVVTVTVRPNSTDWTVVLPTTTKIEVGGQVALKVNRERVHWFDAKTGNNLNWAATPGGRCTDPPAADCEP